jgi:rhamnosyltransferase
VLDNCSSDQPVVLNAAMGIANGSPLLHVTGWEQNRGLGAGYNHAISWARDQGLDELILLDQDSILTPGSASALLSRKTMEEQRQAVVAVAALPLDPRRRSAVSTAARAVVQSSGCMIDVARVEAVGPFDDELFIHHVDQDWFLRARARGYATIVEPRATLDHLSGDDVTSIGRWSVPRYSPTRIFFVVRNTIWMLRRSYVPLRWKARYGTELLIQIGLHLIRRGPRRAHVAAMRSGTWAGFRRANR